MGLWQQVLLFALGRSLAQDVTCPVAPEAESSVEAVAGCPVLNLNAVNSNLTHPTTLKPGCPFTAVVGKGEHVYLKINRAASGLRLQYKWAYPTSTTLLTVYSFEKMPDYLGTGVNWEWYFWPASTSDEIVWYENKETSKDNYHCHAVSCSYYCGDGADADQPYTPCRGPSPDENLGDLYISLSGYFNDDGETVTTTATYDFLEPGFQINEDQLQAIKDIHSANCKPSQQMLPVFPDGTHWERASHVRGDYSVHDSSWNYPEVFNTSGGEADSDAIPFCDWLYGVDLDALTTTSCEDINGVFCNADGFVEELKMGDHSLQGALPASFSQLTQLRKVDLSSNQLSGPMPQFLFASPLLETLTLSHNFFEGSIACPAAVEPELKSLVLSYNRLSGSLPGCLFDELPKLQYLSVAYNDLSSPTIPTQIKQASSLTSFYATHTGLSGYLPPELKCLTKLKFLGLARNQLTGDIPQEIVDGLTSLYLLDLGGNQLTGPVPHFTEEHTELRRIYLDHNQLEGSFEEQLTEFSRLQTAGAVSEVILSANHLSGPLPGVFYNLLQDADRISTFEASANNFRCGPDGDWPEWALRYGSSPFGTCTPVAKPTTASAAVPGELMTVEGSDFLASDELRCRLGGVAFRASFVSHTQISCTVPSDLPTGQSLPLSVANYGDDFSSADTLGSAFVPVSVDVTDPPPPDGLSAAAIAGIAVGCVALIAAIAFIFFLVHRERRGMPVFRPLVNTDFPGTSTNAADPAGGGVEVATTASVVNAGLGTPGSLASETQKETSVV